MFVVVCADSALCSGHFVEERRRRAQCWGPSQMALNLKSPHQRTIDRTLAVVDKDAVCQPNVQSERQHLTAWKLWYRLRGDRDYSEAGR